MSEIISEPTTKKKGLGRGLGSLLGPSSSSTIETPKSSPPDIPSSIASNLKNVEKLSNQSSATDTQLDTQNSGISSTAAQMDPEGKIWKVAIDKLSQGLYQPRKHFEKTALEELAQSIKENGILQPIVVRRKTNGKLEIVAGERRWRAAQIAGLHEVPVLLRTLEDKQALELAIVENIQREDLNPIDEAEAYQRLILEFHLSQAQIAERVGKERATVANAIRLLSLQPEVRQLLADQKISVGHAKVLLSLPDQKTQTRLAQQVAGGKMSVRSLEKIVQTEILALNTQKSGGEVSSAQKKQQEKEQLKQKMALDLAESIQKTLGTRVVIDYSNSKGKLSIYFYSDEELNNLASRIKQNGRSPE